MHPGFYASNPPASFSVSTPECVITQQRDMRWRPQCTHDLPVSHFIEAWCVFNHTFFPLRTCSYFIFYLQVLGKLDKKRSKLMETDKQHTLWFKVHIQVQQRAAAPTGLSCVLLTALNQRVWESWHWFEMFELNHLACWDVVQCSCTENNVK